MSMQRTAIVRRIVLGACIALIFGTGVLVSGCATVSETGSNGAADAGTTAAPSPTTSVRLPPVIYRAPGLAPAAQSKPVPLVIALHGGSGATPALFANATGLDRVAAQNGFVVAYLDSPVPLWRTPADISYIGSMITQLKTSENIDPQRVYVVGFSIGGFATFHTVCQFSSQIAAIAIVSTAMAPLWKQPCHISQPVSQLSIVGSSDLFPVHQTSYPISADQTASIWRQLDGCSSQSQTVQVGPTAQTTWNHCNGGASVGEYVVQGGTHRWPGSPGSVGGDGQYSASPAIWNFLSQHRSGASPPLSASISSLRVRGGRSRQVRVTLRALAETSVVVMVTLGTLRHVIASKKFRPASGKSVPMVLAVPKRTKRGRYRLKLGLQDSYGRTLTIVRTISVPSLPSRPRHSRRRPSRHAG
jgi:poly(3-hydroxybutyrate) depolymerase